MANESSSRRVLLVDDDECIRALCAEALAIVGHRVSTAADGAEALDSLAKEAYDLVVTDMNMPGLGGAALYRRAVERYPHMERRFVFMTGDGCGAVRSALKRSDSICLAKPFRVKELIDAVATAGAPGDEGLHARENRGKRGEQRFSLIVDCAVSSDAPGASSGAEAMAAAIENVSRNGVGIRYAGAPLKQGDGLSISFGLDGTATVRRAEVAWSKGTGGGECVAGVRLVEPLPVYWILSAVPRIDRAHNF